MCGVKMLEKTQGWEIRLTKHIEKMRDKPFTRGRNDCVLFAGKCIAIMTGSNLIPGFGKPYKSKKQAYILLKKLGYKNLTEVATDKLGKPLPGPAYAQRGDCVLIEVGDDEALAIVDLSGRRAVTMGVGGLTHYAMKQWVTAWKV